MAGPTRARPPRQIPPERRYPLSDRPPREPEPPNDGWREEVIGASGLNAIVGLWLIISPWVLGYAAGDPKWNPVVFGAVVTVVAGMRMAGAYRESWLSAVNMTVGVWLFLSAFWLSQSAQSAWNAGIAGVVVFVFALWSLTATEEATMTTDARRPPRGPAGL